MGKKARKSAKRMGMIERRELVARGVLAHKSVREIAAEIQALPAGQRPRECSEATIWRDVRWVKQEWAKLRPGSWEELVGEEVARLEALETVWWPKALAGNREATGQVLAIQRQRAALLGIGLGGGGRAGGGVSRVQVEGSTMAKSGGEAAAAGVMRVTVEYVDDWREA